MKTSTLNSLKKCKLPVFFLHGTGDTTVPYQMTIANYNVVRGEKYLKIIEGAEHIHLSAVYVKFIFYAF